MPDLMTHKKLHIFQDYVDFIHIIVRANPSVSIDRYINTIAFLPRCAKAPRSLVEQSHSMSILNYFFSTQIFNVMYILYDDTVPKQSTLALRVTDSFPPGTKICMSYGPCRSRIDRTNLLHLESSCFKRCIWK